MDHKKELANVNNLLVMTHPTGEDILIVAEAISRIRNMLQNISSEENGGVKGADSV